MRTMLTMAVLALCAAGGATAGDRPPPLSDMFMKDTIEAGEAVKAGGKTTFGKRQRLALVGRDDLIVDEIYSTRERPTCEPLVRNGAPVDPLAEIAARAAFAGRLVIVNEAHDDAQSRAFVLSLLEPLHALGFSYYAAETFYPDVGRSAPAWPRLADGFYSYEPTFGEVLRRARSLGFEFVPYEAAEARKASPDDLFGRIAERETMQSQNIMDRIVTARPAAKALIHAGYSHVNEAPIKWGDGPDMVEWMSSRLRKISGIDPLTVDQTLFQSPLDRPVVCALTNEREKTRAAVVDLTIALPKPVIRRGRPDWRRARGQVDIDVPASLVAKGFWSIVEARYADEPAEAVPADRILLAPGEVLPLLLKPGRYRVEAWRREHGWSSAVVITVN